MGLDGGDRRKELFFKQAVIIVVKKGRSAQATQSKGVHLIRIKRQKKSFWRDDQRRRNEVDKKRDAEEKVDNLTFFRFVTLGESSFTGVSDLPPYAVVPAFDHASLGSCLRMDSDIRYPPGARPF